MWISYVLNHGVVISSYEELLYFNGLVNIDRNRNIHKSLRQFI